MWAYYRRWIATAFGHSYGMADGIAGFLSYVLAAGAYYFPSAASLMETIGVHTILWALAGVTIYRIVLAPYWMWKEDQKILQASVGELAALNNRLTHAIAISAAPVSFDSENGEVCFQLNMKNTTTDLPIEHGPLAIIILRKGEEVARQHLAEGVFRPNLPPGTYRMKFIQPDWQDEDRFNAIITFEIGLSGQARSRRINYQFDASIARKALTVHEGLLREEPLL